MIMQNSDESEYFDFQKHQIYYRKSGSGKPLVFIHNAGASHIIWEQQITALSKMYTCYAIDLPGYGKSISNADDNRQYSLAFYTDFLSDFLTQKKITAITLIGNCLGSAIALNYTRHAPENIKSLILFHVLSKATVTNGSLKPVFLCANFLKKRQNLFKKFLGKWSLSKSLGKFLLNIQFGSYVHKDTVIKTLEKQIIRKESQIPIVDILLDIDSYKVLDEIEITSSYPRIMVIWGSKNRVLRIKDGQKFCKEKKINNFKNITGGGHLVMYEMAEVINPLLQEFLNV